MIQEIPIPFRLYRGDLTKPPTKWDDSFNLETNYGKKYGEKGPKNKAGLYFFHDHIDVSHSYAQNLLVKENKEKTDNFKTEYHITETCLKEPIRIIDFSKCHSMFMITEVLFNNGIDVLTDKFINHQDNNPFSHFLEPYHKYKETNDSLHLLKIRLIKKGDGYDYSYFGQAITDFENGVELKKLLVEKNLDGYRWREHDDPRGLTYCLVNSEKISAPITNQFDTNGTTD